MSTNNQKRELPTLLNSEMVRADLDNRNTQAREGYKEGMHPKVSHGVDGQNGGLFKIGHKVGA